MNKASEMGRISATGSFHLFMGKTISTVIMAVGTIILGNLMLEGEYGLYAVALILPLTITLFQDWGVSPAMTKYIAQNRATDQVEDIRDIIIAGLVFKITTGLILSFTSLFLANYIATTIFNRPEVTTLIAIASLTVLADSLLTASQSNFNGFEKMELHSLTMVSQSTIKTTVSPLLVLLGYGALGAVLGHTFSLLVAGIIGLAILYFLLFKKLPRNNNPHKSDIMKTLKAMLRFGVPLSISTTLGSFLVQFYGFVMAFYCTDVMIGNYHIAANFAVLLTFFTFPITTVLFPAFSKLDAKNDPELLQTVFTSAVKYTAMLLVPATIAIMVLSKPLIYTLFGEKWIHAPLFLTLSVITNLAVLFGGIVKNSFLAGLGETKILMKLSLLSLSFGIPLAFILIPTMGIVGVILGIFLTVIPTFALGLYWTWKHYGAKADYKSSTRILVASAVAATTTYLTLNFLNTAEWIRLIIGGTVFLIIYIIAAPMIGAINQSDINNLKVMLSGLGIISKLISIPLLLAERISEFHLNGS